MVQRVIGGGVIGTQGTPVAVLAGMTTKELFPQLWAVRNRLTRLMDDNAVAERTNVELIGRLLARLVRTGRSHLCSASRR